MKDSSIQLKYFPENVSDNLITYQHAVRILGAYGLINEIDDLYQEMCRKLIEARQKKEEIGWWYAVTILRNLAITELRKRKRKQVIEQKLKSKAETQIRDHQSDCLLDAMVRDELLEMLIPLIKQLDERERVILRLRVLPEKKLTFKEIGKVFGYSGDTARRNYDKILKKLKKQLECEQVTKL